MQKLHGVKLTQMEMVRDRGYDISAEAMLFNETPDGFDAYAADMAQQTGSSKRGAMSRFYTSTTTPKRTMLVYYGGRINLQQKQVAASVVREFIDIVLKHRLAEAVLIVDAPISSKGNEELKNFTQPPVQVFHDNDLAFNPTTHIYTPRHELVLPGEEEALLRSMRTDRFKMLIIKEIDPIVRYYGWKAGSIVRIYRDDSSVSVLTPQSINYRYITK